jgi:hypothetical protein
VRCHRGLTGLLPPADLTSCRVLSRPVGRQHDKVGSADIQAGCGLVQARCSSAPYVEAQAGRRAGLPGRCLSRLGALRALASRPRPTLHCPAAPQRCSRHWRPGQTNNQHLRRMGALPLPLACCRLDSPGRHDSLLDEASAWLGCAACCMVAICCPPSSGALALSTGVAVIEGEVGVPQRPAQRPGLDLRDLWSPSKRGLVRRGRTKRRWFDVNGW